jgi:EAL domain-containing protein (putative c-di-GMP-specific phosphodiesterase class I)
MPWLIAQRICDEFVLALHTSDYEMFSTASIGITYGTEAYQEADQVLRDADVALYRAKASGRNQYVVFDPSMQTQVLQRLQLENDLRRALDADEFFLHYQPIISLATGQLKGFEALVRWQHPHRGRISPLEVYSPGRRNRSDWPDWMVGTGEACQQLAHWLRETPCHFRPIMNVNLSAIQLETAGPDPSLDVILQTSQIPRECLKLEITESCILETSTSEAQSLKQLKDLGIRLCIDDFGTGYSSLSRLHEFPIDTLKIDRSFVQRLNHNSLETVQMIITLAHGLDMDVVAEGIETATELALLQRLGCELGQGYWYAPPLPAEQAQEWLESSD